MAIRVRPWLTPDQKADALRGTGMELLMLNKLDQAKAALQDSLRIEPNHEMALKALEYIEHLKGNKTDKEKKGKSGKKGSGRKKK